MTDLPIAFAIIDNVAFVHNSDDSGESLRISLS